MCLSFCNNRVLIFLIVYFLDYSEIRVVWRNIGLYIGGIGVFICRVFIRIER